MGGRDRPLWSALVPAVLAAGLLIGGLAAAGSLDSSLLPRVIADGPFALFVPLADQFDTGGPVPSPLPTPDLQPATSRWQPPLRTPWQWQLTGKPDLSVDAQVYDLDLFDTDAALVDALHAAGRRAICYVSLGSFEDWRPDADTFPAAVKGRALDGWPGERWLDIRNTSALQPIIAARLDLCKSKGFDAVEPDNIDGYTNRTGFPLTAEHQLAYNRLIAREAHARGLAVALKNDLDQVGSLVNDFDFAINEQCFQYDECDLLLPFIQAGKPVFQVEYGLPLSAFCSQANALNFNAIRKNLDLDAYRESCR